MIKFILATGIQTFIKLSQVMATSHNDNLPNKVLYTDQRGFSSDFKRNIILSLECILRLTNRKYNVESGIAFLRDRPIYSYMTKNYLPIFKDEQYPEYDVSKRHFYEYRSYFNPLMLIMAEIDYANEYKPSIKESEHLKNYVLDLKNILALFSNGNPKEYWNWFSFKLKITPLQTVDDAFSYIYLPPQNMLAAGKKLSDYDRIMNDEHAVRWALKTGAPISELPKFLMVNMDYEIECALLPEILARNGNFELFFGLKTPVYRLEYIFYHGSPTPEMSPSIPGVSSLMTAGQYELTDEEVVLNKGGDVKKEIRKTTNETIMYEYRYEKSDLVTLKKHRKIIAMIYRKIC